jgi:hypothetical protein
VHGFHPIGQTRFAEMASPDVGQGHDGVAVTDLGPIAPDDVHRGHLGEHGPGPATSVEGAHQFPGQILHPTQGPQRRWTEKG